MATQVVVQDDGVYIIAGSQLIPVGGIPRQNADGSITVRWPARDVTVAVPLNPLRWLDMSDLQLCVVAVLLGGVTVLQIAGVRPGVAAAVNTFLTNNSLTAGSSP